MSTHTHQISGSGTINSAYYSSKATAEAEASALVPGYADVKAGLVFNGFVCPNLAFTDKSWRMDKVTITSVTSSWSLLASLTWFELMYSGKAKFNWEATITCKNKESSDEIDIEGFIRAFKAAVKARSRLVKTIANGSLGNTITSITFGWLGDGCVAWALWVLNWLYGCDWYKTVPPLFEIRMGHLGNWPLVHQIIIIKFKNGEEYVLDPWRSKENPVHRKSDYDKKYGPIKDGFSQ